MKKESAIRSFALLVFVLPVMAYAILNLYEKRWEKLPVWGMPELVNGIKIDHSIGDFSLINQEGKIKNRSNWNNRIVIADFFFTHCTSICPKMTFNLKKVNEAFKDDNEIRLASFSVDPERDSAAQFKVYASRFGIDTHKWDFLTGDKREIYRLARTGFMIVATDGDGGPNDFIHSEKLVLLDRKGRIRGYYNGTSDKETAQLIQDIKKLKHED